MLRKTYFDYIEKNLNLLSFRIKNRGKINLLDLNIHSENFFAELCNLIFNLNFVNANVLEQNMEGIDLIDEENNTLAQVSSTCTKQKIENSLNKEIYKDYQGFNYKFISIAVDAPTNLKKQKFKNLYNMSFNAEEDLWDLVKLLRNIQSMPMIEMRQVYDLVKEELGQEIDYSKVDTNLAYIVEILAKENLDIDSTSPEINEFAIEEKIEFNDLTHIRGIIDDYKIFYNKLDAIYSEFDKQGKNKSFSVFQEIRRQYIKLKNNQTSFVEIFYQIAENLISIVQKSSNYSELPFEELQICIDIIVVDSFIRCKIFENPGGYSHVIT